MTTLEYATANERRIARQLVKDILTAGHTISVHDGEDFAIKRSADAAAILKELAQTGADNLIIRRTDGERVGFVSLVWGNDCDLISDHSDCPEIEALQAPASALANRLQA
jgi:hypothetical protein